MNFATTKKRIIQYIDFKGVSVTNFFNDTGIKRGFLDTDKLNSTVSDLFLAKIIATYEDLNLYWLITGNGKMLVEKEQKQYYVDENKLIVANEPFNESELVKTLKETVIYLKKEVEELKDDKELLKSVIKTKLGKQNAS